jgi:hypothetical protein
MTNILFIPSHYHYCAKTIFLKSIPFFPIVAEPHHFYAAPGKNFGAAPAPAAPTPTLL